MKAVVQRVVDASVTVSGVVKGAIRRGLLVYLGVAVDDSANDADWLAEKIAHLRIFEDNEGKMNLSLLDIVNHADLEVNKPPSGVLAVSQFTLLGDARKGRRPSWAGAAPPDKAREQYLYFMEKIRGHGLICESGEFQARMNVTYTNEGPVTILLDSRDK
ncbi:MAG: D-tyrosyl-tRNA(Tyr) deacylase [Treponema sp.]|jgi:D-tyrosyl-tRNA(Tyr) deacylase|nr:D-tyrosyl-tRNA(Tyr) deacylase [Treponema sp.]